MKVFFSDLSISSLQNIKSGNETFLYMPNKTCRYFVKFIGCICTNVLKINLAIKACDDLSSFFPMQK